MAAIIMGVNKGRKAGLKQESYKERRDDIGEHVSEHNDPTAKGTEEPVARFQRFIRENVLYKRKRLHRVNLAERLHFESATTLGLLRFFNQLMVFALFVAALSFSSDQEVKRGILTTLDNEFDFEGISDVARRDQFVSESMAGISEKSKEFFILSNKYFDDQGIGSTQLIRDITTFSGPKLSTPVQLAVLEFSFTAWVKVVPQFVEGYILRKRLVPDGPASGLACWGWYLSMNAGPQFHYGCHDFFQSATTDRQISVGLSTPGSLAADQFHMLTMVVDQSKVHFYRNTDYLGAVDLPRPVTDCFNDGEGLLVGESGMDLSLVRFHPRALTMSSIEELFAGGSLLSDISTGSQPSDAEPEGLKSTERALASSIGSVNDAVSSRQASSEINQVLKTITEERASPPPPPPGTPAEPVDAPLGNINASSIASTDAATGKDYYSLAFGPWRLSPTSEAADHRSLVNLPNAEGQGFTMSWWYRHMPCSKSTCGVFLFVLRDDTRTCYGVWLETVALWFENALGTPSFQYPQNFVDQKFQLNDDFNWRHMALVFDETTDIVKFYMDGKFVVDGPWGSAVTGADCNGPNKFMALGRYGPFDYTYGADVDIYDFRQYIHTSGPLTDADILAIATAPTPELDASKKCLSIDSLLMADSSYQDTFGHDCEWFFKNKKDFPSLCTLSDAARECPVACGSRQQCVSTEPDPPMFVSWDRIRRIESVGSNGTICLAGALTPEKVKADCEAWTAQHVAANGNLGVVAADFEAWADSVLNSRRGRRVNMTSCEELMASIDPECTFDQKAVEDFTAAVNANGGDWTIAFWIRPTGEESKIHELGNFYPHVQFLGKLSPPQHNLAVGLWANPFGEARVFSECERSERDIYDNIEMSAADPDGWTMISISRKNADSAIGKAGDCTVVTNIARNWEGSALKQCLYDPTMFMQAIEVNYPSLMSPIMMIPKALPLASLQESYFMSADSIRTRSGPIVSNHARVENAGIEIDKLDYSPRSILMAPPIVFQTKTKPAKQCPFTYATQLIEDEHKKMEALKCDDPFQCSEELQKDKFLLYACPGDRLTAAGERVFGLEPADFNGNKGFADFLYSIVDHPILWRDGELRYTEDFIDSRTEMAQVILVFFTPDAGTTSVLTATADFSGFSAATVEVTLQHYQILEGDAKWIYLALQVLVMVNLIIMFIDIFVNFKQMVVAYGKTKERPSAVSIVKQLIDFGTIGMCVAFIVLRIPQKFDTAPETERIVGGLSRIPWDSVDVKLEEKTTEFFSLSTDLLDLIVYEQNLNKFCNVILIISLLRVVQCTSLHPRLALLTGTIAKSFDDMWHSCILVVLLMGCFAGVASWRFGGYREDFGNFEQSMQTQFEMLFGEFPDDWTESRDMQAYTVLYIMIMFLLIQNFLLAIIVEAYMKVREHNEKMKTHQEITLDIFGCINAYVSAWRNGWPTPGRMGQVVESWQCKWTVGFKEAYGTGMFKSQESAAKWVVFYHGYEFLEPDTLGAYGYERQDDSLVDQIESRVARLMGKELPLREYALNALQASRHAGKLAAKNGSKDKGLEDTSGGSDSSVVKPARRAPPGAVKADKSEIQRDLPMEHVRADLVHSEHAFSSHHQAELEHLKAQVEALQAQNADLLMMNAAPQAQVQASAQTQPQVQNQRKLSVASLFKSALENSPGHTSAATNERREDVHHDGHKDEEGNDAVAAFGNLISRFRL